MQDFNGTDVAGAILRAQMALLEAIGPVLVMAALGLCVTVGWAFVHLCLSERRSDDRTAAGTRRR